MTRQGCRLTFLAAPAPPARGTITSAGDVVARDVVPAVAVLLTACPEQPLRTSFRDANTGERTSYTKRGEVALFHCGFWRCTLPFTDVPFTPQPPRQRRAGPTHSSRRRRRSSRAGRGSVPSGGGRSPRCGTGNAPGSPPRAVPARTLGEGHSEMPPGRPPPVGTDPELCHQHRACHPHAFRVRNGTGLCQSPFLGAAAAPSLTQLAGQPRPALGTGTEPRGRVTRATVLAEAALAAAPPVETQRAHCRKAGQISPSEKSSGGKQPSEDGPIGTEAVLVCSEMYGEEPTTPEAAQLPTWRRLVFKPAQVSGSGDTGYWGPELFAASSALGLAATLGCVTLLARGSRPPGRTQTAPADVVAGRVMEAVARLAAVLAVAVSLARCGSRVRDKLHRPDCCWPSPARWSGTRTSTVRGCCDGSVGWVLWCWGN